MADIFDPRGDNHWHVDVPMLCAGTCTKGYAVAMDSSGDVTNAATATLSAVVGIACESGVAGEVILVRVAGYCDFIATDGAVTSSDLVLSATNGGTCAGRTEADLTADPTLAFSVVAKNLLAADTASNTAYGYIMLSAGM